jgi:hypothetical protein
MLPGLQLTAAMATASSGLQEEQFFVWILAASSAAAAKLQKQKFVVTSHTELACSRPLQTPIELLLLRRAGGIPDQHDVAESVCGDEPVRAGSANIGGVLLVIHCSASVTVRGRLVLTPPETRISGGASKANV